MNPKPLLLLNHFTVPLFFLPTTTAAAPGGAAAAAASSAIPQPRWTKTSTEERRASPPVHPPLFLPQNPNSAAFCSSGHYLFLKISLTLSCSDFLRTLNCFSEFEKTDTAAERSDTEREGCRGQKTRDTRGEGQKREAGGREGRRDLERRKGASSHTL